MPKTVDEYIEQTKELIEQGGVGDTLEPTSALLHCTANSSMVGSGFTYLPDFGVLVCWVRYGLTPDEFDTSTLPLWKYSEDELRQRRAAAEAGFDQLLEDFVQRGYEPDMGERLLKIGKDNFHEYSLNRVYVLPRDLDEVLDRTGNPLADFPSDSSSDEDEGITAAGIGFDLNNPVHREKLAERLFVVG